MSRTTILSVLFTNDSGDVVWSRNFQTLRAARKWAKWLEGRDYTTNVRIMRGGPGGEEVA